MKSERATFTYADDALPTTIAGSLLEIGGTPIFVPHAPVPSRFRDGSAVMVERGGERGKRLATLYTREQALALGIALVDAVRESL